MEQTSGQEVSRVTDPVEKISLFLSLSLSASKRKEDSKKIKLKRRKSSYGNGVTWHAVKKCGKKRSRKSASEKESGPKA